MTRRHVALAAMTLLCLAGAQPGALASEESGWMDQPGQGSGSYGSITCESRNDARRHCAVRNIDADSVSVQRRLSETHCQRGSNWGVDRDGIWVDGGCRAVFSYGSRQAGSGGSSSNRPGGGYGTINCESHDDGRKHCDVPGIDPSSVTMERKLSHANCNRGQNWDADSRGIWVDNGCRAKFAYVSRGGGYGGGGGSGASESSMRNACIDRAAREWAVTASNLEITHAERMQNGGYRFNVQSKRSSGTCMVDRGGNVYRLDSR